jgi:phosphatidylglycerophosphatase A
MNRLWLCVAQGFYIGRIPTAPGTFGSLLGLGWFAILAATGSWWCYAAGCVGGFFCSVWLCGKAEQLLQDKDPGSVVLDEITAMPVCFAGWICTTQREPWATPPLSVFFAGWGFAGVFLLFRFFDVAKPWPVRQSQALPGGWGVTVDDFLAAGYVNLVVEIIAWVRGGTHH